jgi:broad specificity phosphatase PhoE
MTIHLVRHGETAHNRDHLGLGRSDVPLTPLGKEQAAAVARAFGDEEIAAVFCSPLQRAEFVAKAIGSVAGRQVEPREELLEMDVGDTEGMTFPDMREKYPEFFDMWRRESGHEARMPGGESIGDVANRLRGFVAELRDRDPGENLVVVSHNFVQRALMCELLGLDLSRFRSFVIELASITTIGIRGRNARIVRLNDVCHLRSLESSGNQT